MTEIEDENTEAGTIVQEIQAGYMLGERLLRPALVGVAKRKMQENEEKNDKKAKKLINLNENSNVLVIGCEGNADVKLYKQLLSKGRK